jgi:hypothetical protein
MRLFVASRKPPFPSFKYLIGGIPAAVRLSRKVVGAIEGSSKRVMTIFRQQAPAIET